MSDGIRLRRLREYNIRVSALAWAGHASDGRCHSAPLKAPVSRPSHLGFCMRCMAWLLPRGVSDSTLNRKLQENGPAGSLSQLPMDAELGLQDLLRARRDLCGNVSRIEIGAGTLFGAAFSLSTYTNGVAKNFEVIDSSPFVSLKSRKDSLSLEEGKASKMMHFDVGPFARPQQAGGGGGIPA
ncbi:hypothetical protein DFP72DRAFT_856676 [Ephemerocybe angulata]|uniref:Uncharacterized protein n=1 Tax=Ephemerocybe angulata TaxID=980116 RepID=A0A8H6HEA3_9AGAR|nr:hypothetical protein DFP72DRAFT_856676 [Tulosesus angulatus]